METTALICFSVICGIIISFLLFSIYTVKFYYYENKDRDENKKLLKKIEKLESELAIRDEYISSKRRNK